MKKEIDVNFLEKLRRNRKLPLCLNDYEVLEKKYGFAKLKMKIDDCSKNEYNIVHGGIIFSLMDNAAGYSALLTGKKCVTLSSNINFIKGVSNGYLYAIPKLIHEGKNTLVFEVDAIDDSNNLIAHASFTMFSLGDLKEVTE